MNDAKPESPREPSDPFVRGLLEHLPAILRYVRVSVPLRDADDLTQDVFTQACASRAQFSGNDLGPWLYQIARTKIGMYYRRQAVERRALEFSNVNDALAAIGDDLLGAVATDELQAAIDALEEAEREAIRLKFSHSYSNKQIAELLRITPNHLGVVLHRALQKLRQKLNPTAQSARARTGKLHNDRQSRLAGPRA